MLKSKYVATLGSCALMIHCLPTSVSAQSTAAASGASQSVDLTDARWGVLSKLANREVWGVYPGVLTYKYKFTVEADGSILIQANGYKAVSVYLDNPLRVVKSKYVANVVVGPRSIYFAADQDVTKGETVLFLDEGNVLRLVGKGSKDGSFAFTTILVDSSNPNAKAMSKAGFAIGVGETERTIKTSISDMQQVGGGSSSQINNLSPMFAVGASDMRAALTRRDLSGIQALMPKLSAVASTDGDRYELGQYMLRSSDLSDDQVLALQGLTLMAASGKIPLKDMPAFYGRRGSLLAANGKYREADSDLRTAMEMGFRSEAIFRSASAVKEKLGDAAAAQQFASKATELEAARLTEERRLAQLKQEEAARIAAAQKQREQEQRIAAQAPKKSGGGLFGKLMAATGGALAMASGGGGASDIIGGAMAASRMVNGSGDWVPPAAGVNPLTGAGVTGNVNPLISSGRESAAGDAGQSATGGFATKPNVLDSSDACSMMDESNYRQVALSGGNDVQLRTMCGQAFEYYTMYKRAIDQGYSETDCNRTYSAHEKAAANAIAFYNSTRTQ